MECERLGRFKELMSAIFLDLYVTSFVENGRPLLHVGSCSRCYCLRDKWHLLNVTVALLGCF